MATQQNGTDRTSRPARPRFMRLQLPRILNFAMFCCGCFMLGTGLAIAFRLPPGSRGGHGLTMLGWDRHQWGDAHLYVGVAIALMVVAHLALHWGWLKGALRSAKMRLGWLGLGAGLLLLAMPLLLPVNKGASREPAGHLAAQNVMTTDRGDVRPSSGDREDGDLSESQRLRLRRHR